MSLTSDSDRPAPADGVNVAEENHRVSLGVYLRCRYWGRFLLNAAVHAIVLGVADAAVPMLTWQLCLLALCNVVLLSVASREQLVRALLMVVLPAAGIQTAQFLDRPDDVKRLGIMIMSLALAGFALYTVYRRKPGRRAPHHVVLNLADGRQIPLLVGKVECKEHPTGWHAVSANGPVYLTDDWTVSHGGSRRQKVEPLVYHDEAGRAYVPDVRDMRDAL
jgi:hypothetical protein